AIGKSPLPAQETRASCCIATRLYPSGDIVDDCRLSVLGQAPRGENADVGASALDAQFVEGAECLGVVESARRIAAQIERSSRERAQTLEDGSTRIDTAHFVEQALGPSGNELDADELQPCTEDQRGELVTLLGWSLPRSTKHLCERLENSDGRTEPPLA